MATPDPEVEEILATLGETPLAWLAAEARAAVEALPDLGATAGAEVEAANLQLRALEEALLEPIRRELTATERIGGLADALGLSPKVELLLEDGEAPRRIVLNSDGRRLAMATFVETLDRALGQARERVTVRERSGQ